MAVHRPVRNEVRHGSDRCSNDDSRHERTGKPREKLRNRSVVSQGHERADGGRNDERKDLERRRVRDVRGYADGLVDSEFGFRIFALDEKAVVGRNAPAVFSGTPHLGSPHLESVDLDGFSVFGVGEFKTIFFRVDAVVSGEKPFAYEVGEIEPMLGACRKLRIRGEKIQEFRQYDVFCGVLGFPFEGGEQEGGQKKSDESCHENAVEGVGDPFDAVYRYGRTSGGGMRYDEIRHHRHDDGVDSEFHLSGVFGFLECGTDFRVVERFDDALRLVHVESPCGRFCVEFVFEHGCQ